MLYCLSREMPEPIWILVIVQNIVQFHRLSQLPILFGRGTIGFGGENISMCAGKLLKLTSLIKGPGS